MRNLFSSPNQGITISGISESKYYGVDGACGKAFFSRQIYEGGFWEPRCFHHLTKANAYDSFRRETLKESIEAYAKNGYVIFEFDTYQELLKWALE